VIARSSAFIDGRGKATDRTPFEIENRFDVTDIELSVTAAGCALLIDLLSC
jgi:hypothetical protein